MEVKSKLAKPFKEQIEKRGSPLEGRTVFTRPVSSPVLFFSTEVVRLEIL